MKLIEKIMWKLGYGSRKRYKRLIEGLSLDFHNADVLVEEYRKEAQRYKSRIYRAKKYIREELRYDVEGEEKICDILNGRDRRMTSQGRKKRANKK